MTDADTLARVAEILRRTFRDHDATVSAATAVDDVQGWDLLTHGLILMEIERAFRIRFTPAELVVVESMDELTVGTLVRAIDARLAAGGKA